MKKTELIKEVKSKIETLTYEGIDEAINLVKEYGSVDFFDTFLGDLQLRCDRYNSDHVCSEAKFFNRGKRVMASHFTYRALLGLVNIACEGSKAYDFRSKMKKINLIGHIWQDGNAYGGNVDLKYLTNFESITEIRIEEAGTISNLDLINSFKNVNSFSICGPLSSLDNLAYSLRNNPLISTKLSLPIINLESSSLENLSLECVEDIENLQFIGGLKNFKKLSILSSQIKSFKGIPTSIENFSYKPSIFNDSINDSEFETLRNLNKLHTLEIESKNSDFSFLADLTQLDQLTITSESEKVIIPNLSKQNKIRYLSIPKSTLNLDFMCTNQDLEMISLFDSFINNLKGLENCHKIKVIDITNCEKLINLSGLENTKELDITIRNTGIENLDGLNNCTRLSKFTTKILENFNESNFSSTEVETFSDGSNDLDTVIRNNTLDISDCPNLIDISGIKNATNLMGLSITRCLQLKALTGIDALTNLYDIDLSECTELEDISIIKNFPKLRSLNLSGCKKLKVKPENFIMETQEDLNRYLSKL